MFSPVTCDWGNISSREAPLALNSPFLNIFKSLVIWPNQFYSTNSEGTHSCFLSFVLKDSFSRYTAYKSFPIQRGPWPLKEIFSCILRSGLRNINTLFSSRFYASLTKLSVTPLLGSSGTCFWDQASVLIVAVFCVPTCFILGTFPPEYLGYTSLLSVCVVFGPRMEYEPAVCLGSKGSQQHLGCINRSTASGRREVIIPLSTC